MRTALCFSLATTATAQPVPFGRGFNFGAWFHVEGPRQIQFNKWANAGRA